MARKRKAQPKRFKRRPNASKRKTAPPKDDGRDATTGRFLPGVKNGGPVEFNGLKPALFKEAMRDIASNPAALQFVDDVVQGKKCVVKYTMFGKEYKARPSASERGFFWVEARNAGYGRPPQALQMSGNVVDLAGLAELISKAEAERGLEKTV